MSKGMVQIAFRGNFKSLIVGVGAQIVLYSVQIFYASVWFILYPGGEAAFGQLALPGNNLYLGIPPLPTLGMSLLSTPTRILTPPTYPGHHTTNPKKSDRSLSRKIFGQKMDWTKLWPRYMIFLGLHLPQNTLKTCKNSLSL